MYTKISNKIIREFSPCYDPSEVIFDENEELTVKEWVSKYGKLVKSEVDIIWLLCRNEFISDKNLRLFAVWCARESLKNQRNIDQRIIDAINISERFANGDATIEELSAARSSARSAARSAAWSAAESAAWSAARSAAESAARSAAWSSARSAAWSAAESAARPAAWSAARPAQIDKLLTYFE